MFKSFAIMACAVSAMKMENALTASLALHDLTSKLVDDYIECDSIWDYNAYFECLDDADDACYEACED